MGRSKTVFSLSQCPGFCGISTRGYFLREKWAECNAVATYVHLVQRFGVHVHVQCRYFPMSSRQSASLSTRIISPFLCHYTTGFHVAANTNDCKSIPFLLLMFQKLIVSMNDYSLSKKKETVFTISESLRVNAHLWFT